MKEQRGTLGELQALRALDKPLGRYRWSCQIATGRNVRIYWRGVGVRNEEENWEYVAVRKLLELLEKPKGLDRLYRCGFCRKTLLARTNKGRPPEFCPDTTCKQLNHDRKPENKKNKSEYMKEYYEDGKKRLNNRKSGVGLRASRTKRS